jgi:hypothetical protein
MFGSQQWMYSSGGFYPKDIDQSLRFNDDDSAYLSRTPSSSSNRGLWTWSAWIKLGNLHAEASIRGLFGAGSSTGSWTGIYINDDKLYFESDAASTTVTKVNTNALLRDVASWYHIVVVLDTTESSSSDRVKIYLNNQLQTLTTSTIPTYNSNFYRINDNVTHSIGAIPRSIYDYLYDGYMAEVHFVDGAALTPSSFGETKQNIWVAKDYSGSHGTNGFYLPFDDSSAIGDDESSNTNDWTANNLVATDVVLDSPTNNWCTINSVGSIGTQSEGNLKQVTEVTGSGIAVGSIGQTSGKWYWEVNVNNSSSADLIGVVDETLDSVNSGSYVGYLTSAGEDSIAYYSNGNRYINGSAASYGATYTTGDIIGVAFNLDDNEITFYKNNSSQGAISYTFSGGNILPAVCDGAGSASVSTFILNFGQDSSFAGSKTAQGNADSNGNGDFYYSPPSGYLALCAANLPDPAIDPNQGSSPENHFNTVLATGNASTQSITGVGFQPDFVWMKVRSHAVNHISYDSVRGVQNYLVPNLNSAEAASAQGLTSFDSDGFTLGNINPNSSGSYTFAAWNWKANGTSASNTDGSITSTVSANTTAGFSIVSYTGTGSNATIGHGLNSAPAMVIVKSRSASYYWAVYHKSLGAGNDVGLSSGGDADPTNNWNSTTPTSSVFSVPSGISETNYSGVTFIAYCFAEKEGFSKFGSYTGNGNADGTFVYLGFRPALVIVKKTSGIGEWVMLDNKRSGYNKDNDFLYANETNSEFDGATYTRLDLTSNGFKHRDNSSDTNGSGATYVYMAFAEQPFKYSNAR